jgi:hypothetical protein
MTEAYFHHEPLYSPKVCPKGWHKEYVHFTNKRKNDQCWIDATITIFVRGTRKKKD